MPEVASAALNALWNLAAEPQAGAHSALEAGAPAAVLAAGKSHPTDPKIVEYFCGCVTNLASAPEGRRELVDGGAVDLVLAALGEFPGNVCVAHEALAALANLASLPEAEEAVRARNGIAEANRLLKEYPDHAGVQEQGCRLVRALTLRDMASKRAAGETSVLSALKALRSTASDPRILESSLAALASVCSEPELRDLAFSERGVETIINVLHGQAAVEGVQEAGCSALTALLKRNPAAQGFAGSCAEVVTKALRTHSKPAVAAASIRAMAAIAESADGATVLASKGGVESVVGALATFAADAHVQAGALAAVANLAMVPQLEAQMVGGRGVESVVKAMAAYPGDPWVQAEGCRALRNLTVANRDGKAKAIKAGALPCVIAVVQAHAENAEAATEAFPTLAVLLSSPEAQQAAIEAGAVDAALTAVRDATEARSRSGLLTGALIALASLMAHGASGEPARLRVSSLGGLDVLVDAVRNFSEDEGVVDCAFRALGNLVLDPELAERVVTAGTVAEATAILGRERFRSSAKVVEAVCGFLRNLCADPAQCARLAEPSLSVLTAAVSTLKTNAAAAPASAGCAARVLAFLVRTSEQEHAAWTLGTQEALQQALAEAVKAKLPEAAAAVLLGMASLSVQPYTQKSLAQVALGDVKAAAEAFPRDAGVQDRKSVV